MMAMPTFSSSPARKLSNDDSARMNFLAQGMFSQPWPYTPPALTSS
jgi:hypothetical protein